MSADPWPGGRGMLMDVITQRLTPEDPVSHSEPTVFLKRNVIFYKGFKIFPLFYHVVHCLLSVLEMISGVSLQLVTKRSEQAIAIKTKIPVKASEKRT